MRRIGILTAGGDTPALNATIFGAVERASELNVEVLGLIRGFAGLLDPRVPYVKLNPLLSAIPELDPCKGGTLLGASRTYVDPDDSDELKVVTGRLRKLGIEGLVCIGGDGTLNGMQPLSEHFPCILAPKTIDNDLGLNYLDEPNEYVRDESAGQEDSAETASRPPAVSERLGESVGEEKPVYRKQSSREEVDLAGIVNYATPGYATAVFVVAQGIQRLRTTAESHRRIAIVEVMGRQSGFIALGSAYGQPDVILIPEVPLDRALLEHRVRELYDLQEHAVIVVGEGVVDETGRWLGAVSSSVDPAGNVRFSGAAEELKRILAEALGDEFFRQRQRHDSAERAIFTRKVGHTQRGGRPIQFDRFHAAQLGGKAVELLVRGENNTMTTLDWSAAAGFGYGSLSANRLRDRWNVIHPRTVHPSLYDPQHFGPSKLGVAYLKPIFTNAIGADDVEHLRTTLFNPGNLTNRYQSVNVDVHKRLNFLDGE